MGPEPRSYDPRWERSHHEGGVRGPDDSGAALLWRVAANADGCGSSPSHAVCGDRGLDRRPHRQQPPISTVSALCRSGPGRVDGTTPIRRRTGPFHGAESTNDQRAYGVGARRRTRLRRERGLTVTPQFAGLRSGAARSMIGVPFRAAPAVPLAVLEPHISSDAAESVWSGPRMRLQQHHDTHVPAGLRVALRRAAHRAVRPARDRLQARRGVRARQSCATCCSIPSGRCGRRRAQRPPWLTRARLRAAADTCLRPQSSGGQPPRRAGRWCDVRRDSLRAPERHLSLSSLGDAPPIPFCCSADSTAGTADILCHFRA